MFAGTVTANTTADTKKKNKITKERTKNQFYNATTKADIEILTSLAGVHERNPNGHGDHEWK